VLPELPELDEELGMEVLVVVIGALAVSFITTVLFTDVWIFLSADSFTD